MATKQTETLRKLTKQVFCAVVVFRVCLFCVQFRCFGRTIIELLSEVPSGGG